MTRLTSAWRAMDPERRLAAVASLALLVTMFLPWYSLQSLNRKTAAISTHSISAFGDVSFVEAAVFLVAAGVLTMLFARAEGHTFHLPGSDGTIAMIAGGWAALLIFYRVFDRPAGGGYPVGIQWGFFLAFVAAGALTYAGWRMRATHRPEPPLVRTRRPRRPPAPLPSPTSFPPAQGPAPGPAPAPAEPVPASASTPAPAASAHAPAAPVGRAPRGARRPVPADPATEQLSFEDEPTDPEQRSA
jgi:hypothetical protein